MKKRMMALLLALMAALAFLGLAIGCDPPRLGRAPAPDPAAELLGAPEQSGSVRTIPFQIRGALLPILPDTGEVTGLNADLAQLRSIGDLNDVQISSSSSLTATLSAQASDNRPLWLNFTADVTHSGTTYAAGTKAWVPPRTSSINVLFRETTTARGNTIFTGGTVPNNSVGQNGDYAIVVTSASVRLLHKASGAWVGIQQFTGGGSADLTAYRTAAAQDAIDQVFRANIANLSSKTADLVVESNQVWEAATGGGVADIFDNVNQQNQVRDGELVTGVNYAQSYVDSDGGDTNPVIRLPTGANRNDYRLLVGGSEYRLDWKDFKVFYTGQDHFYLARFGPYDTVPGTRPSGFGIIPANTTVALQHHAHRTRFDGDVPEIPTRDAQPASRKYVNENSGGKGNTPRRVATLPNTSLVNDLVYLTQDHSTPDPSNHQFTFNPANVTQAFGVRWRGAAIANAIYSGQPALGTRSSIFSTSVLRAVYATTEAGSGATPATEQQRERLHFIFDDGLNFGSGIEVVFYSGVRQYDVGPTPLVLALTADGVASGGVRRFYAVVRHDPPDANTPWASVFLAGDASDPATFAIRRADGMYLHDDGTWGAGTSVSIGYYQGRPGNTWGKIDLTLSDAQIGDKAFKNPPSTLNDNQKATVRSAIGVTNTAGITQTQADSRYLRLAGGTLTGALTLSGAPTSALHAATKMYVDAMGGGGGGAREDVVLGDADLTNNDGLIVRNLNSTGTVNTWTDQPVRFAGDDPLYDSDTGVVTVPPGTWKLIVGTRYTFIAANAGSTWVGYVRTRIRDLTNNKILGEETSSEASAVLHTGNPRELSLTIHISNKSTIRIRVDAEVQRVRSTNAGATVSLSGGVFNLSGTESTADLARRVAALENELSPMHEDTEANIVQVRDGRSTGVSSSDSTVLTANFTPLRENAKVLIQADATVHINTGSSTVAQNFVLSLYRGDHELREVHASVTGHSAGTVTNPVSFSHVDTLTDTSQQTYTLRARRGTSAHSDGIQNRSLVIEEVQPGSTSIGGGDNSKTYLNLGALQALNFSETAIAERTGDGSGGDYDYVGGGLTGSGLNQQLAYSSLHDTVIRWPVPSGGGRIGLADFNLLDNTERAAISGSRFWIINTGTQPSANITIVKGGIARVFPDSVSVPAGGVVEVFLFMNDSGSTFPSGGEVDLITSPHDEPESFLGLSDTPSRYTGHGGKVLGVNSGETAITFVNQNTSGISQTAADSRYLRKSGGTLTGALTLSGDPSSALHAATKRYVDSMGGSASAPTVKNKTANYTVVAGDLGDTIRLTGSSPQIFTLPDSEGTVVPGWYVRVANDSTAALTLDGHGSDTIEGSATRILAPGQRANLQMLTATTWAYLSKEGPEPRVLQDPVRITLNTSGVDRLILPEDWATAGYQVFEGILADISDSRSLVSFQISVPWMAVNTSNSFQIGFEGEPGATVFTQFRPDTRRFLATQGDRIAYAVLR